VLNTTPIYKDNQDPQCPKVKQLAIILTCLKFE